MCKDNLRVILYAPKPVDTVQHCLKQNVSSQNEIYLCIFALQIWKTSQFGNQIINTVTKTMQLSAKKHVESVKSLPQL